MYIVLQNCVPCAFYSIVPYIHVHVWNYRIIQETKYVLLFLFEQSQLGNFSSLESALAEALQQLFFLRSFLLLWYKTTLSKASSHIYNFTLLSYFHCITVCQVASMLFIMSPAFSFLSSFSCYRASSSVSTTTDAPKERVDTLILPPVPLALKLC